MRETPPRGWHRWRIAAITSAPPAAPFDHTSRRLSAAGTRSEPVAVAGELAAPRVPDGIRHELVARIRQQLADGTYDTEAMWLIAEDALLRRIEGRA